MSTDADALAPISPEAAASLERAMGGRQALRDALACAPPTDGLAYVINLIAAPDSDTRSLGAICRAGGITLDELLTAYKRGRYAQMQVAAIHTIATEAPKVVEDVFTRAQPHYITCPECRGTRLVPSVDGKSEKDCDCTRTDAPGLRYVLPDLARQKLALESADLLPKAGPLVVNDNRRNLLTAKFDATPAGFSALLRETDDVLHRRGRGSTEVVEAEPMTESGVDASPVDP